MNIEAWDKYLHDYPNRKLLQYIKFCCPLSLSKPFDLHNVDVSNHASAIQFSSAVSQYISKESALGAILGQVDSIDHSQYHYSPILTRPKDNDIRRVILYLSHPKGTSANDNVIRDQFHGAPFDLKFSNIDNILDEILKVDIARAFNNLRVNRADGLKL